MKQFNVPVVITMSGWIIVDAEDIKSAKIKAEEMANDIVFTDLEDSSDEVKVMFDEIEEIVEETKND